MRDAGNVRSATSGRSDEIEAGRFAGVGLPVELVPAGLTFIGSANSPNAVDESALAACEFLCDDAPAFEEDETEAAGLPEVIELPEGVYADVLLVEPSGESGFERLSNAEWRNCENLSYNGCVNWPS